MVRLLVRRRLGQPLDRRRRDQHRAERRLPRPARCRFCSSARTTAGASRCRPRPAGSRRRTGPGPGWSTSPPTAPTRRPRPSDHRERGPLRTRAAAAGVPAPEDRALPRPRRQRRRDRLPAGPRRSRPTTPATRCWPPPAQLVGAGVRPAEVLARYEQIRARDRRRGGAADRRPTTGLGGRGDGRRSPPGGPEQVAEAVEDAPVRQQTSRQAADPGRVDQRHPGPDPGRRPPGDRVRRGRRRQGRGVRRDPRPGPPARRGPGLRHRAGRAVDPRAWRWGPDWPG